MVTMLAALGAASPVFGHGRDPHSRVAGQNGWQTDLTAAKAAARKANKPLMVVLRCFD